MSTSKGVYELLGPLGSAAAYVAGKSVAANGAVLKSELDALRVQFKEDPALKKILTDVNPPGGLEGLLVTIKGTAESFIAMSKDGLYQANEPYILATIAQGAPIKGSLMVLARKIVEADGEIGPREQLILSKIKLALEGKAVEAAAL